MRTAWALDQPQISYTHVSVLKVTNMYLIVLEIQHFSLARFLFNMAIGTIIRSLWFSFQVANQAFPLVSISARTHGSRQRLEWRPPSQVTNLRFFSHQGLQMPCLNWSSLVPFPLLYFCI